MIHALPGLKYNQLTLVSFAGRDKYSSQQWLAKCDCGNEKVFLLGNITGGRTKSCGCIRKGGIVRHGMSKTKIYRIWAGMRNRCFNINNRDYEKYGGRGITVCERWLKFENFLEDMGERPKNKTLDRIDNNGNYEPENCMWSDGYGQANNQSNNRIVTYNGESKNLIIWARQLNINYNSLMYRLDNNWSVERAFTTPIGG